MPLSIDLSCSEFIYGLCKELNEKLQECGQLSMLGLSKNWDLPTDVFTHYVLTELGLRIDARRIDDQLYTTPFLNLQERRLRAALIALEK